LGSLYVESRKNHGVLSDVRQVACAGVREFIFAFVHPPQPSFACVMSMIQSGLRKGPAEAMNTLQSSRVLGEKIFVPMGQLFFSMDLWTRKQPVHFRRDPAEYFPVNVTALQTHPSGLPSLGTRLTSAA